MTSKLALGTVQFGVAYGINNKTGRIPEREAEDILKRAASAGIDTLDTSQAYGESEAVLGRIVPASGDSFRIVSKFTAGAGQAPRLLLKRSLDKLKRRGLYGFLYHKFTDFGDYPSWLAELNGLKEEGLVRKIGFSVYYPREIESLLEAGVKFDLVQAPYSIFDRRFEPLFGTLKKAGVEIHVRSVFLQGLAFMEPCSLPGGLAAMAPKLENLRSLAGRTGVPLSVLCLGFALNNSDIDRVVIGVDGARDLENNLSAAGRMSEVRRIYPELQAFAEEKEDILLPFKWKK